MRQQDDDKKQRVKDAVRDVILEEGFAGASISKIAKRAGVSPATVYIYYENKEDMMRSIYADFTSNMWSTVLQNVDRNASGADTIDRLLRNYFRYITENATTFSYVEQFSSSPALIKDFSTKDNIRDVLELIEYLKEKQVLKPYDTTNIFAILFFPAKALASGSIVFEQNGEALLAELIHATQDALLLR